MWQCISVVRVELSCWDWESLGRDELRAGCQLVLDVGDVLQMLDDSDGE